MAIRHLQVQDFLYQWKILKAKHQETTCFLPHGLKLAIISFLPTDFLYRHPLVTATPSNTATITTQWMKMWEEGLYRLFPVDTGLNNNGMMDAVSHQHNKPV